MVLYLLGSYLFCQMVGINPTTVLLTGFLFSRNDCNSSCQSSVSQVLCPVWFLLSNTLFGLPAAYSFAIINVLIGNDLRVADEFAILPEHQCHLDKGY